MTVIDVAKCKELLVSKRVRYIATLMICMAVIVFVAYPQIQLLDVGKVSSILDRRFWTISIVVLGILFPIVMKEIGRQTSEADREFTTNDYILGPDILAQGVTLNLGLMSTNMIDSGKATGLMLHPPPDSILMTGLLLLVLQFMLVLLHLWVVPKFERYTTIATSLSMIPTSLLLLMVIKVWIP